MFGPRPLDLGRGRRSDRHGVIERHTTLALSRSFLDPGDISTHWAVEEHGPQVTAFGHLSHDTRVFKLQPGQTVVGAPALGTDPLAFIQGVLSACARG